MAKRFTSTELWEEDWFLNMPNEYKLFWFYMLSNCDHAGIFKVNLRSFCSLLEVSLTSINILSFFNSGKQRIREVSSSLWFVEDFFVFQYGTTFNINNPLHRGIQSVFFKHGIELTSIRGLKEVNTTLKEKEIVLNNKQHNQVRNGSANKKNGFIDPLAQGTRNILDRIERKTEKYNAARANDNSGKN